MRTPPPLPADSAPPLHRRAGFTFLEILVVVLIMGILTAIVIPRYSEAVRWYRVDLAAERIAADLRLARGQAMTSSTTEIVKFDVNTNSYSIPGLPDLDHPGQAHAVNLGDPRHQCTLLSAEFGGTAEIRFDQYGTPTDGGTVVVGSGSYARSIAVESGSGKVTVP